MPLPSEKIQLPSLSLKSPVRRIWMYTMPGLTEKLMLEAYEYACKPNNLFLDGQLVNLSADQWDQLKEYCREKLNLPANWDDLVYLGLVEDMKKKGWMTTYGPSPIINKKKLKEDRDLGKQKVQEKIDNQGGLF